MWRVRTLCQVLVDVLRVWKSWECDRLVCQMLVDVPRECENPESVIFLCVRCWLMYLENVKILRVWSCDAGLALGSWTLWALWCLDMWPFTWVQTTIVTVGSCQEVYILILDGVVLSLVWSFHTNWEDWSQPCKQEVPALHSSTTSVCVVWLDWSALRYCTQVENDQIQCCTEGKE